MGLVRGLICGSGDSEEVVEELDDDTTARSYSSSRGLLVTGTSVSRGFRFRAPPNSSVMATAAIMAIRSASIALVLSADVIVCGVSLVPVMEPASLTRRGDLVLVAEESAGGGPVLGSG